MSSLHPSTLPLLSLISSLTPVTTEVQQPHLSHLFSQFLHQIYSPRHTLPRNWKEWRKAFESKEAGVEEKCEFLLDKVERTCVGLLRDGIDAIQDWIHHDLLCLVSTEEDEPTELNQSPLLRTSPLGLFIRKSCLSIERMSFTEIWSWFECTKKWFQSSSISAHSLSPPPPPSAATSNQPLSNPQALLLTALGYLEEGTYDLLMLSLEECFKISRSFGDKVTLRGCWSLLKRIPEKYRKRFLNEVIGQTNSNDDKSDSKGKGKMLEGETEEELSNPHDILFEVYQALLASDRDQQSSISSLTRVFPKLYLARILAISSSSPSATSTSNNPYGPNRASHSKMDKKTDPNHSFGGKWEIDLDCFEMEMRFVQGEIWNRLGISPISKAYQDLVLDDGVDGLFVAGERDLEGSSASAASTTRTVKQDLRLRVLLQRADQLSTQSDRNSTIQALKLLLTSIDTKEKRIKIGLDDRNRFSDWKQTLLRVLQQESLESGSSIKRKEGLQPFGSELPTPTCSCSATHLSPSVRLASNLSSSPNSPPLTLHAISQSIDLVLSRLEMTSCTSTTEALRGLEELEALESRVLVFSSSAFSNPSSSSANDLTLEVEEEEMEEKEVKGNREEWGEMKRGRKVEAKYWETLARVKIVANDFDEFTVTREIGIRLTRHSSEFCPKQRRASPHAGSSQQKEKPSHEVVSRFSSAAPRLDRTSGPSRVTKPQAQSEAKFSSQRLLRNLSAQLDDPSENFQPLRTPQHPESDPFAPQPREHFMYPFHASHQCLDPELVQPIQAHSLSADPFFYETQQPSYQGTHVNRDGNPGESLDPHRTHQIPAGGGRHFDTAQFPPSDHPTPSPPHLDSSFDFTRDEFNCDNLSSSTFAFDNHPVLRRRSNSETSDGLPPLPEGVLLSPSFFSQPLSPSHHNTGNQPLDWQSPQRPLYDSDDDLPPLPSAVLLPRSIEARASQRSSPSQHSRNPGQQRLNPEQR
ncbi:hypothetical protein JCM3765_003382 [Sporobolomyces pararoseus]